jgi:hypothetical protein
MQLSSPVCPFPIAYTTIPSAEECTCITARIDAALQTLDRLVKELPADVAAALPACVDERNYAFPERWDVPTLQAVQAFARSPEWFHLGDLRQALSRVLDLQAASTCTVTREYTDSDVYHLFVYTPCELLVRGQFTGLTDAGRRLTVASTGVSDAEWDQLTELWDRIRNSPPGNITHALNHYLRVSDHAMFDTILQPRPGVTITTTLTGQVGKSGAFFRYFANGWKS